MRVFISWSGSHSQQLAATIRDWLPSVLQSVEPYFTPNDVEKGARWLQDIAEQLEESQVGILCLTRDSLESEWLMFEAGALSKSLDTARVCPVLFGVTNADLSGPLRQFQTTHFNRDDFKKLVELVNAQLGGEAISERRLETAFEKWWPDLENTVNKILEAGGDDREPLREDRELLEEVVENTRRLVEKAKRPAVSQAALLDLVTKFTELHDTVAEGHAPASQTLTRLKRMRKAIDYLAGQYAGHSPQFDGALERFRDLDYSIKAADDDFPPEEDLPF